MLWLLFWIWSVNAPSPFNCGILKASGECTTQGIVDIMKNVSNSLDGGDISGLQHLETAVVTSVADGSEKFAVGKFVSLLYRKNSPTKFAGLSLYANENQASTERHPNVTITVQLPKELPVDRNHRLALIMVTLPQKAASVLVNSSDYLYNNRLVGLSVKEKSVSGLQEFVNISMNVTTSPSDSHRPQCVFLNYSTQTLDTDGCLTLWEPGQDHFVCSCDHLTFFGVLMVSNQVPTQLSKTDVDILTYMTFIGCSISFCALLSAVLLFTLRRDIRSDVSMKIHVSLAIALLFLNMHFLPNTAVGIWHFSWPSPWLCFYLAVALHFSLLASFSWMAVEGFHLYLLLVKIFNIHVSKYLLKVSLVGWVDGYQCEQEETEGLLNNVSFYLDGGDISGLEAVERAVIWTEDSAPPDIAVGKFVSLRHTKKPCNSSVHPCPEFDGLSLYVSDSQASTERHPNVTITVQLPKELPVDRNHSIAFNMVKLPQKAASVLVNSSDYLYNNRLVSLSVKEKSVSGLQEFVNISMNVTTSPSDSHRPQCVFLNYTTQTLDTDGCLTLWEPGQDHFVCSCDHLTFFGVLMVSNQVPTKISQTDVDILTYMTFIGCSISFCALLSAVFLFTLRRDIRSDVSMKIHVSLAIALLFLNMHFLPNTAVGIWHFSWPSPWLCFYLAVALHFSLLASFSWMAVEGFHLYLFLVKIFNIHVSKYLLKVSLVGWGVPVVVVGIVVSISKDFYGTVSMNQSNSTEICYIRQDLVKQVTTLGLFSLMFLFNFLMLMVAVRKIVSMRKSKLFGPNDCNRAKKDICTLLGVVTLLGTTWGLIFFSFGRLTTIGLYAFCFLNPLQGLFIFLWFLMVAIKKGKATTTSSTETQSSRVSAGTESH